MEIENNRQVKTDPIRVEKWPSESKLKIIVVLISITIWLLLLVTIVGFIYAALIGLFFYISHLVFISYIRGSAIRLGTDQFPELYKRIQDLSLKAGLTKTPEAYIMQAGGELNALATKLMKSRIIVIYSDMLEACGDNKRAQDMIIGHEIGHIKAGHLDVLWFLLPGLFFPFLGSAYSRAREFTCDRYGSALCNDMEGSMLGLAILSAGGKKGPDVNLAAFTNQRKSMNNGLMTIGKWFGTHPPLCDRIVALNPEISSESISYSKGIIQALIIIFLSLIIPTGIVAGMWDLISGQLKSMNRSNLAQQSSLGTPNLSQLFGKDNKEIECKKGFKLFMLTMSSLENAESAKIELENGRDIQSIASKYSIDGFKEKSGFVGCFEMRDLSSEFQSKLSSISEGQFTEPFLLNGNYIIIGME